MTEEEKQALYEEFLDTFLSTESEEKNQLYRYIVNKLALGGEFSVNFSTNILSNQTFTSSIDEIQTARYGAAVRSSIVNALNAIATACDNEISRINSAVNSDMTGVRSAVSALSYEADKLSQTETRANAAYTLATQARQIAERISTAVANEPMEYVENRDGTFSMPDASFAWDPEYDNNNGTFGAFVFRLPKPPQFTSLSIDRSANEEGIVYNPNRGILQLNIPDEMRRYAFAAERLGPNSNPEISVGWSDALQKTLMTFKIPQGATGRGAASALNWMKTRPFIKKLWEPAEIITNAGQITIPANGSYFPRLSIVFRTVADALAESVTKEAYEVADPFDLMMIVFRKSVDNKEGVTLKQIGSNASKNLDAANADYNATTVVWLAKGERTVAMYHSPDGKTTYAREVRWLTEDLYMLARAKNTNTTGNTWSKTFLGYSADKDSDLDTIVETFPNAIFIGDCWKDKNAEFGSGKSRTSGNGAQVEYRKGHKGEFSQGVGEKYYNMNKDYNQYMIPMAIYGFAFTMPQPMITDVDQNLQDLAEQEG